jgi:hypothetical protein
VGVDWGAHPINFRAQFLDASGEVIIAEWIADARAAV